ncbi:MAG TPA: sigma-54 dependent transcriptional regulator [Planctomycetota bacterium]|nr:sigma-54 dependent transcriptional regulator [Planctomycetota bacterium]
MTEPPRILLVEDDRENGLMLKEVLSNWGYAVTPAFTGDEALRFARSEKFELVLADIRMPKIGGLQVLREIRQLRPLTQVVMMTGFGSVDTAVEAMKAGAFDYVSKPFKFDEIKLTLSRALEHHRALAVKTEAPPEAVAGARFNLVGHSRAMAELYKTIAKVAPGRTTVLIQGESGTGKELVARAIHQNSDRTAKPFVAINCAALPDMLLESELFGYTRGAHSTAVGDKPGVFEVASGGTLLLDEVGDMSISLQSKLLRVLEESETRRLGDTKTIKTDVRILASSNKNLLDLVKEGKFRADLFYRFNVVTITTPPLRWHKEDIPSLCEHFIRRFNGLAGKDITGVSDEALRPLQEYDWPGNVRELEHVIERAVVLNTKSQIMLEDLPEELRAPKVAAGGASPPPAPHPPGGSLQEMERLHIAQVVQETHGNIKAAADRLGIDRKTLYRKLAEYGIEVRRARNGTDGA